MVQWLKAIPKDVKHLLHLRAVRVQLRQLEDATAIGDLGQDNLEKVTRELTECYTLPLHNSPHALIDIVEKFEHAMERFKGAMAADSWSPEINTQQNTMFTRPP